METNKILKADFLDILFEGRNKDYGAYELRKTYNRRLGLALVIMASVCLSAFLSTLLASDGTKTKKPEILIDVVIDPYKEEKKEPLPPPPPPAPKQEQVKVSQFTPPRIVADPEVAPDEQLKEIEELENTMIGKMNIEGIEALDGVIAPPINTKGTGEITQPKTHKEDYDKLFTKVELEARFPGGMEAWRKYLERSLNAQAAIDEGAPVGRYTVKVQFIVDKEGNISNVQAVDVPKECPGCGPEAVKVIKRGGRWEPAQQNGEKVNYQAIQNITFEVTEQ